jgi:hypothetical protein
MLIALSSRNLGNLYTRPWAFLSFEAREFAMRRDKHRSLPQRAAKLSLSQTYFCPWEISGRYVEPRGVAECGNRTNTHNFILFHFERLVWV